MDRVPVNLQEGQDEERAAGFSVHSDGQGALISFHPLRKNFKNLCEKLIDVFTEVTLFQILAYVRATFSIGLRIHR